tara:strand:+ start:3136 stop:3951 length:816 start_codon:yes stop_codon:yes gene_type:complete
MSSEIKVSSVKAKDGTAGISIADTTGRVTFTDNNPVINLGSNATGIVNSPWDHIGSFSSTSDITNGNIKFQNVFDRYHTMYRLIIPYFGVNDNSNNIYLSYDVSTGSKTISAPTWSTTNVRTGSNYRGMSVIEGGDGGVFEIAVQYAIHDQTEFPIILNTMSANHANDGYRGYIDFWMPQRADIWDYGTNASVTSDRGSYYSGGYSFSLYGHEPTATYGTEACRIAGYTYYSADEANDAVTGFVIYNESRDTIKAETTMHLLGLKLNLSTS